MKKAFAVFLVGFAVIGCGKSPKTYPNNLPAIASKVNFPIFVPAKLPAGLIPEQEVAYNIGGKEEVGYVIVKKDSPRESMMVIICRPWFPNSGITEQGEMIDGLQGRPAFALRRENTRILVASFHPAIGEKEILEVVKSLKKLRCR